LKGKKLKPKPNYNISIVLPKLFLFGWEIRGVRIFTSNETPGDIVALAEPIRTDCNTQFEIFKFVLKDLNISTEFK